MAILVSNDLAVVALMEVLGVVKELVDIAES
jgi:hypothetical protein